MRSLELYRLQKGCKWVKNQCVYRNMRRKWNFFERRCATQIHLPKFLKHFLGDFKISSK